MFLGVSAPPDCPSHPHILGGCGSPVALIRDTTAIFLLRQTMVTLKPKLRHRVLHNALKNLPWTTKTLVKMAFSHGNFQARHLSRWHQKRAKCSYVLSKHIFTETLHGRTLMNATSNTRSHLTEIESSTRT